MEFHWLIYVLSLAIAGLSSGFASGLFGVGGGIVRSGLGAGAATLANGIFAVNRKNITIRNGSIRGFLQGVFLDENIGAASSGHLLEDLLLDGNRQVGATVEGSGIVIRNNRVVNTGPTDLSTVAFGIFVTATNTVIANNVVSDTSESGIARGIFVFDSALIEVRGNTILDTRDATNKNGIEINSSTDVTVIGNRILNAAGTGTVGVFQTNSTGVNCIDNTIAGFTTALSGCDFSAGNNLAP